MRPSQRTKILARALVYEPFGTSAMVVGYIFYCRKEALESAMETTYNERRGCQLMIEL